MPTFTFDSSAIPTDYNFSRNKQFVKITVDNATYNENLGNISFAYFGNMQHAILNDTITIAWGSTTKTYTFKAATNIGSMQVAHLASGQDPYEYIMQLADDLASDSSLSAVFSILADGLGLKVVALSAGSAYSLSSSGSSVGTGFCFTQAGSDNIHVVIRPNYHVYAELQGWNGSAWEVLKAISKEPYNNIVQFDMQRYADDFLQYDLPDFTSDLTLLTYFECTRSIRKFRMRFSEIYGDQPEKHLVSLDPSALEDIVADPYVISAEFYMLKAGFDELSARVWRFGQFGYHTSSLPGVTLFLTRQPRIKKISRTQREWLYFRFPSSYALPVLRTRYYDKKGALVHTQDHFSTGPVTANQVFAYPVNFPTSVFGLSSTYHKMEVFLYQVSGSVTISETFTYILDESYQLAENCLYFVNSDSGVDTLRCLGAREALMDFDTETLERTRQLEDSFFDGDLKIVSRRKTNKYIIHTGWFTESQMKYLEELLLSPVIFMYMNDYASNLQVVPVQITSNTFSRHKTNRNLNGYMLEVKELISTELSQAKQFTV